MPANPRSGMSYRAGGNPAEELKKARKGGGGSQGAADIDELSPIELQDVQGNEYLNEMIRGGQTEQAQEAMNKEMPLPPEIRWRMLSSNDIVILASLIYSHVQSAETVTKEMLAVGSVYFNRWEHTMANPAAQKEFGAANFAGLLFQVQKTMPLYYKPDRLSTFSSAARFGGNLPSELDMKTAVACVKAAEQIYTGVNPFPDEYMYMDISAASTEPEKIDRNSHIQFGKLHFWAMRRDLNQGRGHAETGTETSMASTDAAEPV